MEKKRVKKITIIILVVIAAIAIIVLGLNFYVVTKSKSRIITEGQAEKQANEPIKADCILVLGAGAWGDKPSPMLEDRIKEGITLYKNGVANKIIMSGDHTRQNYDEVNIMKNYAIEQGVPSEDIFMDHAGISSYDSLYRAKEIFGVKKVVIVTQKYHLYRSLYIADKLGIEAYGVTANLRIYPGQTFREIREILARDKEFFKCIIRPQAEIMGNKISLGGSGDITNDK